MTSSKKASDLKTLIEERRSTCSGTCLGIGYDLDFRFGPCPDPCDQDILDSVIVSAKAKAKAMAEEDCNSHGNHCKCEGTFSQVFKPQCIAIEDPPYCLYVAAYYYGGDCRSWF